MDIVMPVVVGLKRAYTKHSIDRASGTMTFPVWGPWLCSIVRNRAARYTTTTPPICNRLSGCEVTIMLARPRETSISLWPSATPLNPRRGPFSGTDGTTTNPAGEWLREIRGINSCGGRDLTAAQWG